MSAIRTFRGAAGIASMIVLAGIVLAGIVLVGLGGAFAQSSCDLKTKAVSPSAAGLGDVIVVTVDCLKEQVDKERLDPGQLRLHLNGHQLKTIKAEPYNLQSNQLTFTLARSDADADRGAWTALLGSPPISGRRNVDVGVGREGAPEYPSSAGTRPAFDFLVFRKTPFWWAAAGLGAALILFIWLAKSSDIIRDDYPPGNPAAGNQRRLYSLAKCQMALWLFTILGSFAFLFVSTGDYNHIITAQSLVLLGISGGTGLAAVAIDNRPAAPPPAAAQGAPPPRAQQFLFDLLSDQHGIALHRFQMLVWTIVLWFVYVVSAYRTMTLPEFDANLLTLMGISSGLYLGFKLPEQK